MGGGVQVQEVKVLTDQSVFSGSVQGRAEGAVYGLTGVSFRTQAQGILQSKESLLTH